MSPRSLSTQVVLQKLSQMARLLDILDGIGPVDRHRLDLGREQYRDYVRQVATWIQQA